RDTDEHPNEPPERCDDTAYLYAICVIRGDRGANSDTAVLGDFRSNVANAANVDVAMFFGKCKFRGKMLTHQITIQKGDWTSASFQKRSEQHIGNGRVSGAGESSAEHRDRLVVAARV